MSPSEAIQRTNEELLLNPNLRIVAVSGPGEPLANPETLTALRGIAEMNDDVKFCLSTNGILLNEKLTELLEIGLSSISVSMSTQSSVIAGMLYEWAAINGRILQGEQMGKEVVSRQLQGIKLASDLGICVKVNTILIPDINMEDIEPLSKQISRAGAKLHNIVPLIPCDTAASLRTPTVREISAARIAASKNIRQFVHCRQCRSDVIGVPGCDRIL
jgi:nitrogen fixation protein NifB